MNEYSIFERPVQESNTLSCGNANNHRILDLAREPVSFFSVIPAEGYPSGF